MGYNDGLVGVASESDSDEEGERGMHAATCSEMRNCTTPALVDRCLERSDSGPSFQGW